LLNTSGSEVEEMYIMKIRGMNNMPDFIQVRDADFTLIAYFRADKPDTAKIHCGKKIPKEILIREMHDLPYGMIRKLVI
jgi:hypothetical protein